METYLLKSSIALVVLYSMYALFMKRSTHYQLNRITGLFCVVFSAVFLFFQVDFFPSSVVYPAEVYTAVQQTIHWQEGVVKPTQNPSATFNIYYLVYWIGAGLFFLRFLIGLFSLARLYWLSTKCRCWGFKVIAVKKEISPFTFFNLLFISKQTLKQTSCNAMIMHEQYHRDQWHSLDTLLLEVFTIIFWFNPVIWLFQRDIKATHEYMADQQVLRMGVDIVDYQQLLFEARTGVSLSLGNYLSHHTSLKKRFTKMLEVQNKSLNSYLRVLLFLPWMLGLLVFNSFAQSDTKVKKLTKVEEKQLLQQLRQLEKVMYDIKTNPKTAQRLDLKSAVKHPMYILERQQKKYKVSATVISKISLNTIAEVHVVKGKRAIEQYGEEAQKGVVVIRLKN